MENSDGYLNKITKTEKTKILPLRWFANFCSSIATTSLVKAMYLDEDGNYGYRFKFHSKVWHYLDKPYQRWGTYFIVDTSKWK
jgi:hypothetical protein